MHFPLSETARLRRSFAEAFNAKNNAFGFLRLALAVLVIFSHSFALGGFGADYLAVLTQGWLTFGLASVAMFFVLSGFLICRSASASPSVLRFLWHRFLRIFPGYWTCLVICACVFAPFAAYFQFGAAPWRVFSASQDSSQSYMLHNAGLFHLNGFSIAGLMLIRPDSIAGLLGDNPVPYTINGSLWTLPFEIACYLAVAFLAAIGVVRRARVVFLFLFLGLWCLYAFCVLDPGAFRNFLPYRAIGLLVLLCLYFSAGCVCFLYREKIPHSALIFATCILAIAMSFPLGVFNVMAPVALTYAFLWLAFSLPFARFDRKGDFSYGTYIYAFPVQQSLALVGIHKEGFGLYFAASLLFTAGLAFLSYRLIEAPCLRWKAMRCPFPRVAWLNSGRRALLVPAATKFPAEC